MTARGGARRLAVAVIAAAALCAEAYATQDPPIPSRAAAAFGAGMTAVENQDWPVAIARLAEAEAAAPLHPRILWELGRAEAQAGNEIAAVAWLECFQAVSSDEAAILTASRQAQELKVLARVRIRRLVDAAQRVAIEMENGGVPSPHFAQFASLAAEAALQNGSIDVARMAMQAIDEQRTRDQYWVVIARSLASPGNRQRVEQAAREISDPTIRSEMLALARKTAADLPRLRPDQTKARAERWRQAARTFSGGSGDRRFATIGGLEMDRAPVTLLRMAVALGNHYLALEQIASASQ